jgi:hypothetical protein
LGVDSRPPPRADQQKVAANVNASTERAKGILFPTSAGGERSSTDAAKHVLAEAVKSVDPHGAQALRSEPTWRSHYPRHFVQQEKLAACQADASIAIAAGGLAAVHEVFEFARDHEVTSLHEAMEALAQPRFGTATVRGKSQFAGPRLEIPYRGRRLSGDELLRQLDRWCSRGIMETSHAESIRTVMRNPEWLDLSDRTFILLGAGAEIGPLDFLAAHRANIVAVDLDRPKVWARILDQVSRSACRLYVPVRKPRSTDLSDREIAEHAGADLLQETPELAAWLEGFEKPAAVGCYAYLHGKDHVRVAVAMDALVRWLHEKGSPAPFAYLASATDAFAVPEETAACAHDRYAHRGVVRLWQSPMRRMTRERFYAPNIPEWVTSDLGQRYGVYDGLVVRQGPNYALAKRIQRWRALTVRKMGRRSSANVAPPSTTKSVTTNRAFAAAYAGARHYGIEVFAPETTNALMGTLLICDLCSESSVANPDRSLSHPLELFMSGANHGGLWRSPWKIGSVLEVAAVRGLFASGRPSGQRSKVAAQALGIGVG